MKKHIPELGVLCEDAIQNSVRFYHFQKTGAPFSVEVHFDFGSIHAHKPGAAHFLEHILVSGTKKWPSKKALAEHVRVSGWGSNAYTSSVEMSFPLWCNGSQDLRGAFEYLTEILCESLFDSKTIETERGAIFDEIRRAQAEPGRHMYRKSMEILFPNSVINRDVLGTAEELSAITREDLLLEWKRLLSADSCVVTVGEMSLQEVLDAGKDWSVRLSNMRGSEVPNIPFVRVFPVGTQVIPIPFPRTEVNLVFGLTETSNDILEQATRMFVKYLLASSGGLLIQKLRFEKGLTYSTTVDTIYTKYFGAVSVEATCAPERVEEVSKELCAILEKEIYTEMTEARRADFLRERRLRRKRAWQLGDNWVDEYAYDFLTEGENTRFLDEVESVLESTPIETLKSIAQKIYATENRSILKFITEQNK